jgi:hypothetical protein
MVNLYQTCSRKVICNDIPLAFLEELTINEHTRCDFLYSRKSRLLKEWLLIPAASIFCNNSIREFQNGNVAFLKADIPTYWRTMHASGVI